MKNFIKNIFQKLGNGVIIGTGIIISIGIFGTIYAYTNLPTQTTGGTLTETVWNDLVNKINDIGNRTDNIYNNGGNIGIGATTPGAKLDVAGQVKITGGTPGAGKVLTSDASGLASWQTSVSGKVLQVGYASKADSWSAATTGDNFYNVTGLAVTLTPATINSKVLLTISLYGGVSSYQIKYRILRNGVPIILGAGEGGRPVTTGMIIPYDDVATTQGYQVAFLGGTYVDTPSTTSAITYQIQMAAYNGQTVYLNRSLNWQNGGAGGYDATPVSSLVAMEIAN